MNNLGLTSEQVRLISSFFSLNYNVLLFGSRIKGGWHEYSDLDICIKNHDKVDIGELSFIREKFENSDLPFAVDIVDYHRCDKNFQTIIDATGRNISSI